MDKLELAILTSSQRAWYSVTRLVEQVQYSRLGLESLANMEFFELPLQLLKSVVYYCYCAHVLRISRYSGFLSVMLINTEIFLRSLKLSGESRSFLPPINSWTWIPKEKLDENLSRFRNLIYIFEDLDTISKCLVIPKKCHVT